MTRKTMRRALAGGLALTCVVTLGEIASAAGDAAKGEQLFTSQKCTLCHSVAGKGNKKYPLDGAGGRLSADEIRAWLVNPDAEHAKKADKPVMKMKSYKTLSPDDLDSLVAYVQTLK